MLLAILNKETFEQDLKKCPGRGKFNWGRELVKELRKTEAVAYKIHDLETGNVQVVHSFELEDDKPIHSKASTMPPKQNAVVKREANGILEADMVTLASSTLSFLVVIAVSPQFCVEYRQLNRLMKLDRWPLPKIEDFFMN